MYSEKEDGTIERCTFLNLFSVVVLFRKRGEMAVCCGWSSNEASLQVMFQYVWGVVLGLLFLHIKIPMSRSALCPLFVCCICLF